MATSSNAESLTKRSSKYDSFLKKHLDESTFERVRAYEACIVCSEKDNKAFKFVVLSDEMIYLTENPPKTIQVAAALKDLVDIELVNDFPDFLQGEERANTMHIVITVWTDDVKKSRKKSERSNSPRGSLSGDTSPGRDFHHSVSVPSYMNLSTNHDIHQSHSNSILGEASSPSLLRSKHARSTDQLSPPRKSPSLSPNSNGSSSFDENTLRLMKDEQLSDDSGDEDPLSLSKSMPSVQIRKMQINRQNDKDDGSHKSSRDDQGLKTSAGCSLPMRRPLPQRPESERQKSQQVATMNSKNSANELRLNLNELDMNSGDGALQLPHVSRRRSHNSDFDETDSRGSVENLLDSLDNSNRRKMIIHIYMLKSSSPMFMLFMSAWSNYLIQSTLVLDPGFAERTQTSPRRILSEKVALLFGQLKRELLNSDNAMEDIFNLVNELKTAAEKNFALKKLFWKTPELFTFIIRQLQKYLPKSSANMKSGSGRQQRADEFELVILLVETLALMFRETENLRSRLNCIKAAKGKLLFDLIVLITCFPEVPPKYKPPNARASALLGQTQSDQWKCLADAEVAKLFVELTNIASVVLFELILIAKQNNWGDDEGSFFNITWLIKVLEELRTTEKFVERVVGQAMRFVQPSRNVELSPTQAVLVYQQFSVLEMLMQFSPSVASFIRNNYTEEFKYYIQGPVIMEKLPRHFPISAKAIERIESVMSLVRQQRCKLTGS